MVKNDCGSLQYKIDMNAPREILPSHPLPAIIQMALCTAIIFSADNSGGDITRDGLRCERNILMV